MPDGLLSLFVVLLLVLTNGFFVASEFALVTVRRSRVDQLVAEGHPLAPAVRGALGHLDTYIAATQLGITMASLALGWVGEPAVAHLLDPLLAALPLEGEGYAVATHSLSVAIAFSVITALHIVLGELAPKTIALQRAETTALLVARPLGVFLFAFRLPIQALNRLGNLVVRALGLRPASGEELVHSVEELRLLVVGSREAGVLDETEAEIVGRVLGFAELTVREVMVPRTEMQALPVTATLPEVMDRAQTGGHSRFPVYEGDLDHIVGVLHLKDLIAVLKPTGAAPFDLRRLTRPVLVVPDSLPVDTLLAQLQREQRSLAAVVDEFGGIAGLVTVQDVLQRIVGQLGDEFEAARPPVARQPDGTMLVDGLARIEDVALECGLAVDASDTREVETIGGLVMLRLGRLPVVGDAVEVGGAKLRVELMDGHRVAQVRLISARAARAGFRS
jgi:putative hemolysin